MSCTIWYLTRAPYSVAVTDVEATGRWSWGRSQTRKDHKVDVLSLQAKHAGASQSAASLPPSRGPLGPSLATTVAVPGFPGPLPDKAGRLEESPPCLCSP